MVAATLDHDARPHLVAGHAVEESIAQDYIFEEQY